MSSPNTPQYQNTINSLWKLQKIILDTLDFNQVVQKIVDSVAIELGYLDRGYQVVVLVLADQEKQLLRRISMSQTPAAESVMGAGKMSFDEIDIPFTAIDNFCIKTYQDRQIRITSDWQDILTPPMSSQEARRLQQISGVKNSLILPVIEKDKCIGVLIFSLNKDVSDISDEEKDLLQKFTEIVSLAIHDANLYAKLEHTTKELDEANKHLKDLDKLKDEFVSTASHELRTPMTAIKSYVWMVQNAKAGPISETAQKYLDIVFKSTERLIHMVNDMLDISRIESGKTQLNIQPLNFADLVEEVNHTFTAKAAEKHQTWTTEVPPNLPIVPGDHDKLIQVMTNLVGNAFKFTPDGGTIKLQVSYTPPQPPPTAKTRDEVENFGGEERSSGGVKVSVIDNGPGITPEDQARLFTKFTRVGDHFGTYTQPGTGLGLYLCKQYVELHHGQISVSSVPNEGSTFSFTLPL